MKLSFQLLSGEQLVSCCPKSDEAPQTTASGLQPPWHFDLWWTSVPCKDQLLDLHVWSVSLETGSETQLSKYAIFPQMVNYRLHPQFGAYVSYFLKKYYLKRFSNSIIDFSEELELRRQVWQFWPKYMGYNQVTSTHSQRGSVKSSLQCNSSCYLCPTGLKILWLPVCWSGAFSSAQVSQRKKKN